MSMTGFRDKKRWQNRESLFLLEPDYGLKQELSHDLQPPLSRCLGAPISLCRPLERVATSRSKDHSSDLLRTRRRYHQGHALQGSRPHSHLRAAAASTERCDASNQETLLETTLQGLRPLLDHKQRHHQRRDSSVSRRSYYRTYRRHSVVVQLYFYDNACSLIGSWN